MPHHSAPASPPATHLVTVDWLAANLDRPNLVILDATVPYGPNGPDGDLGRARWEAAHIPGAHYADLASGLSDTEASYSFAFPAIDRLVASLEAFGIGDESVVVIYDDFLNMWATRIWWMLRAIGFERAVVLDGGWRAWSAGEHAVASGASVLAQPGRLTARPQPSFTGIARVLEKLDGLRTDTLVCALPESYFNGTDAIGGRGGHIPGSVNIPAASLLDETGKFLPLDELRTRLAPLAGDTPITIYCGGGISATVVAFALSQIGREDVLVYDGSLEEWNAAPDRPLQRGA